MERWKSIAAICSLLIIAVVLYPHPQAREARSQTEIVFWGPPSNVDGLRTAVEEFERENPQYHVQMGAAATRDLVSDPTRFLLGVAGGSPPDVIYFDRFAVVEWAARGAFTDLNQYLDADLARPDGLHAADFYAPMWNEPRYQGKQYAIPTGTDVRTLFVNDDLLIRAGYVNPDGSVRLPRTWEEVCRKKFDGYGKVIDGRRVQLGGAREMPGVGKLPASGGAPVTGDVACLVAGPLVFRARIASVQGDGTLVLDFSRELEPGVDDVPAVIANEPNLEVKIFDANSYAIRMTRFDEKGNIAVAGFTPMAGDAWLYLYGWQNGATFISEDGKRCTLDSPEVKVALQFMVDCYDALGGYGRIRAYEAMQQGALHPFFAGKIAMRIDGNGFLRDVASYRGDLRFTVAPPPMPQHRLDEGYKPLTWSGGSAYGISATAKEKEAAWNLIRFLTSERAIRLIVEVDASAARAKGLAYVPDLLVRKSVMPWLRETYVANDPSISDRVVRAYDTFVSLLPESKFRPITPIGQKLWEAQRAAGEDALSHVKPVNDTLTYETRWAQENLNRTLVPPTGPVVNWWWMIGGYGGLILVGFGLLALVEIRWRRRRLGRRNWGAALVCASPWLIGFIVFGGGPILFSAVISLCRYDAICPARFIGLTNYTQLLWFHRDSLTGLIVANDPDLWKSLGNTAFMIIGVPLGIVGGLLLAMLLSSAVRGIAIFRTIFYLPSIVPAVASFILWIWVFDPTRGLLNRALLDAGVDHPPAWLSNAAWSKPALILMGLWGIGGGMLIWLAGIHNIPSQLYEAAEIDGAGPLRRFFHVTLPMISPYIFFNTVMGIIGTLQVFEAAFVMTDGGPQKSTLFYAYYLFNQAFRYLDMGAASAMAWILFAIVLTLTGLQAWAGRRWVHYD